MKRCFVLGAQALMVALLMSNAALAQPRGDIGVSGFAWRPWWSWPLTSDPGWGYHPNRCMVWDGYRWLNMCYRSRSFYSPAWARFHR